LGGGRRACIGCTGRSLQPSPPIPPPKTLNTPKPHPRSPKPHQKVIEVNVSTVSADPSKTVDITAGASRQVRYSYSVKWAETEAAFADRMDRYTRYSFLPQHLEVGLLPRFVVLEGGGAGGVLFLPAAEPGGGFAASFCCLGGWGRRGRATPSCRSTWRWGLWAVGRFKPPGRFWGFWGGDGMGWRLANLQACTVGGSRQLHVHKRNPLPP
jgi:hypothetical protein